MGRIPDLHSFDNAYFGLLQQMTDDLDPSFRIIIETAYECIVDAGNYYKNFNLIIIIHNGVYV